MILCITFSLGSNSRLSVRFDSCCGRWGKMGRVSTKNEFTKVMVEESDSTHNILYHIF